MARATCNASHLSRSAGAAAATPLADRTPPPDAIIRAGRSVGHKSSRHGRRKTRTRRIAVRYQYNSNPVSVLRCRKPTPEEPRCDRATPWQPRLRTSGPRLEPALAAGRGESPGRSGKTGALTERASSQARTSCAAHPAALTHAGTRPSQWGTTFGDRAELRGAKQLPRTGRTFRSPNAATRRAARLGGSRLARGVFRKHHERLAPNRRSRRCSGSPRLQFGGRRHPLPRYCAQIETGPEP